MAPPAEKIVSDIGKCLAQQTRPNKDSLVKLLRQAASALSELSQSPSLQRVIEPLSDSLVRHNVLQHKDKDVRLMVAICFSEIIRVLAPDPPFSDEILRDVFKLFVSMFAELSDTESPYFTRRVRILETVAALKCCVLMLDIGCDDLVLEMFKVFFSVVREHHQPTLFEAVLSIMRLILEEKPSQPLLDVTLLNLLKEEKAAPLASFRLAVSIIQLCSEKLGPLIQQFLTSCILDRDTMGSELKEFYHEIIFEIFQCAPQMVLPVIPTLTQELLTDQVDVRIKAVNLLAKIFALPEHHITQESRRQLFLEFLKRFSDKSAEVRVSALQCAKACYLANPSGLEAREVLTALEGRLLDFDDKVRTQAVFTVCDLANSNLKFLPSELILQAADRLRDKKVPVRKAAMQKLLELYRSYCIKCSEGIITRNDHIEQIPCRILMLCYDKDCKDFRPQNMEVVLAEDLFPAALSVEERTSHWISSFSFFSPLHVKALNSILTQKRRLQTEMQVYLSIRKTEKENVSEEVEKRMKTSFVKMSTSFADPSKAEEYFQKLHKMKDNSIFNALHQLLDAQTDLNAKAARDKFLKKIGEKHLHYEFLRVLSGKCMFNIFSSEHVCCILDHLFKKDIGDEHFEASSVKLLLTVINAFPSLLRGSEELFQILLEEGGPFDEKLLQILAKAGPHVSIRLRDIYPLLERVCLEGTRMQSKAAVSAIAALTSASDHCVFSELCKKLVDCLHSGQNIATVLQSLGCIAQYSVSAFETMDKKIAQYIVEKIFHDSNSLDCMCSLDEDSGCSIPCRLKIYGLKTLVKRFLPHQGTPAGHQIGELLDILLKMLQEGDIADGTIPSENDKAHIRLAAAKSLLKLARRWDFHISPKIFHLAVLKARDPSSHVRRLFLDKVHKLLKEHAIPSRYACAFALAGSDCLENALKHMAAFVKEYGVEARIRQTSKQDQEGETMASYPEYVVVFLIHVLAHNLEFPSVNCQNEEIYAQFCSPLFVMLQTLVNASFIDGSKNVVNDTVSYINTIFQVVKKAEDAVDVSKTPKLHMLADFGMLIIKALSCNSTHPSHTHGHIFLPSSFYKTSSCSNNQEVNSNCITGCNLDENFVERLLHIFKSHIDRPPSSLAKRGRNFQGNNLREEDMKHNAMNLLSLEQADSLRSRAKKGKKNTSHGIESHKIIRQKFSTGTKSKHALSAAASKSVMNNEASVVNENRKVSPGNGELNLAQDQLFPSCSSASATHFSTQVVDYVKCSSFEKNDGEMTNVNVIADTSELLETDLGKNCNSEGDGGMNEELVGQRIKLWSPFDKCFYSGTVSGFDSQNNNHKITYDSGEIELLCLSSESWETISSASFSDKEALKFPSRRCDLRIQSSSGASAEVIDAFGDRAAKEQTTSKNKGKEIIDNEISIHSKIVPALSYGQFAYLNEQGRGRKDRKFQFLQTHLFQKSLMYRMLLLGGHAGGKFEWFLVHSIVVSVFQEEIFGAIYRMLLQRFNY
ncbi:sister chromatid cohesion protein PDS5 homolog A isoform X2 [Telopea speciosissima]|uniref:sister chromatid cohesion protein PDS5 homolog A isoform X2 n=1 Tax=Telopea speciosissima TaxID=54955 RepID=UPI001CC33E0C|nr:sister chromatid cohesion protein PDS5 homolog A isoform X2 [Telopea speciosissima]